MTLWTQSYVELGVRFVNVAGAGADMSVKTGTVVGVARRRSVKFGSLHGLSGCE